MAGDGYIYDRHGNVVDINEAVLAEEDRVRAEQEEAERQQLAAQGQEKLGQVGEAVKGAVLGAVEAVKPQKRPRRRASEPQFEEAQFIPDAQGNLLNADYPGVVLPDGPKAEMVPQDGPKAEAALLQDAPHIAGPEIPEDGPKAELARQAAAQEAQDIQRVQAKQREIEQFQATMVANGVSPEDAELFAASTEAAWNDIVGPRFAAAELDLQGAKEKAEAEGRFFATEEGLRDEHAEMVSGLYDEVQKRSQERVAKIFSLDAQIENGQIDPGLAWEDKGTMGKAFIGFGAGLFRVLQMTSGQGVGGANPVVQTLQNAIRTDLAAQEANLNKLFKQRGALTGDAERDAKLLPLKQAVLEKNMMNKISGAIAKMKAEMPGVDQELQAAYLKTISDLKAMKYDIAERFLKNYYTGKKIDLATMKAMARKGSGGGGKGKTPVKGSYASQDVFRVIGGDKKGNLPWRPDQTSGDKTKYLARSRARKELVGHLTDLARLQKRVDRVLLLPGRAKHEAEALKEQLRGAALNIGRVITQSGANFTEQEMEILKSEYGLDRQGIVRGGPNLVERLSNAVHFLGEQQSNDSQDSIEVTPEELQKVRSYFVLRDVGNPEDPEGGAVGAMLQEEPETHKAKLDLVDDMLKTDTSSVDFASRPKKGRPSGGTAGEIRAKADKLIDEIGKENPRKAAQLRTKLIKWEEDIMKGKKSEKSLEQPASIVIGGPEL